MDRDLEQHLADAEQRLRTCAAAGDYEGTTAALESFRAALEQRLPRLQAGGAEAVALQRRTEELLRWLDRTLRSSRAQLESRWRRQRRTNPYQRAAPAARPTWRLEG